MSLALPARAWLFAAACTVSLAVAAQPTAPKPPAAPDPLDAKASVPAPSHESALSRFRRWSDEKPISWRQANDTVAGIGGWRAYAREAQQPDPVPAARAPAAAATPASMPAPAHPARSSMPAGHGGHNAPRAPAP